jgi:hypothetical protein
MPISCHYSGQGSKSLSSYYNGLEMSLLFSPCIVWEEGSYIVIIMVSDLGPCVAILMVCVEGPYIAIITVSDRGPYVAPTLDWKRGHFLAIIMVWDRIPK